MDWVFLVFPLTTLVGVLLEKEFNISIMLVSRSAKFLENLVDSFVD